MMKGLCWHTCHCVCGGLQEDMKSLTGHIVERHYKAFEDVNYVKTFKNLKQRYDQQQDRLKDKQPSLDK